MLDEIFWDIHTDLPREGPGDNECTRRAFEMMIDRHASPRILDVACGPGMQTMQLAKLSSGPIVAVDTHQSFLDVLNRRAEEAGVSDRVRTINSSMLSLPFESNQFDVIWCEGAMYIMGVREALSDWKRFLVPNGYIAFTEPCFLTAEVPEPVEKLWLEYSKMTSIENTTRIIEDCGFQLIGNFTIPESAWWNDYYSPKENRLKMLREKYRNQPGALQRIEETQEEIDAFRLYSQYYGYVFFVIQA